MLLPHTCSTGCVKINVISLDILVSLCVTRRVGLSFLVFQKHWEIIFICFSSATMVRTRSHQVTEIIVQSIFELDDLANNNDWFPWPWKRCDRPEKINLSCDWKIVKVVIKHAISHQCILRWTHTPRELERLCYLQYPMGLNVPFWHCTPALYSLASSIIAIRPSVSMTGRTFPYMFCFIKWDDRMRVQYLQKDTIAPSPSEERG